MVIFYVIKDIFDNYEIIIFLQNTFDMTVILSGRSLNFVIFNPKLFKPFFSFEIINFEKINKWL